MKKLFLSFLFSFLFISFAIAQTTLVTLEGALSDEEGNALPGATVNVKNIESGYAYNSVSRADGRYVVSGIQPGKYEVEVSLSGFGTQIRQGLTFNIGAKISLNFTLKPTALQEALTVTAEAPIVEITKSEVSSVVTNKELDDLPLFSRNFSDLSTIKPGVQSATIYGIRSNALPRNTGEYLIDGVSNEEILENYVTVSIPADAIQEFRVMTNQFAAEYGNAAGIVLSALTKSGTNEFKGRVYGFYRDEALDSVNYFIKHKSYQGETRTKEDMEKLKGDFTDYRYGGFLGGPLIKDKLHFFLSYEYHYYKTYFTTATPLVPVTTVPQEETQPMLLLKLNYQLNEKNNFSFRFSHYKQIRTGVMGGLDSPELAYTRDYRANAGQLNWTFYPSDKSMNELRLHYSDYERATGHDVDPTKVTFIRPSGNFGKYPNWPQTFDEPRYQIVDNFSLFLGNHILKLGLDYSYIDLSVHAEIYTAGTYVFITDKPFNPVDPMTYPYLRIYNTGPTRWPWPFVNFGFFIQDSWKVNSRLTMNYGLRYNWYKQEYLDISNKNLANNLNPRFGLSWDPMGDGKTVIRGGIGTFSLNTEANHSVTVLYGGTLFYEYWPGYPDNKVPNPFTILYPTIFTHYTAPPTEFIRTNTKTPYTLQATLGVQREIFTNFSVGLDLVFTRGYDLFRFEDINPVIPGTTFRRPNMAKGAVYNMTNNSRSEYKALYLTIIKRFSKGWSLDLSYTLSRSMTDTESPSPSQESYDPDYWKKRYGPAGTDARHRVVVSGVVDLPLGFQLSAIFNYNSKTPWTAYYMTDVNKDGLNSDLLDSSYNARRGFDFLQLDSRISNFIRIDKFTVQAFLELYNLTNRANFYNIYPRQGSPLFSKPLAAGVPRLIQIGLRFNF